MERGKVFHHNFRQRRVIRVAMSVYLEDYFDLVSHKPLFPPLTVNILAEHSYETVVCVKKHRDRTIPDISAASCFAR